jgi:adenylosuccinate synthase
MVLGVCKAYTTRVGSGPFPSELLDEVGDQIREQGQEYGTTTGRPRRCGWLDLVALKRSARINSLGGLIVTRLDVLSGIGPLKFVVGYEGVEGGQFPTLPDEWQVVKPVYRENEGWDGDIRGVRRFEDLPKAVRDYVRVIEEQTGVPAAILSIGPDRSETIIVRPDLVWG